MVDREEAARALQPLEGGNVGSSKEQATERLAQIERLTNQGKWAEVLQTLSEQRGVGQLSPTERLIWAIAQKEHPHGQSTSEAHRVGIQAMSELLGVAPDSPLALIVAKRALRTVAGAWRSRPAPKPLFSFLIIIFGVGFGAAIGWIYYLVDQMPH